MALANFIKNIRNIMRQDKGVNGDAQRIEQLSWMLFLKIYDEKENDWEFNEDHYVSFIPENCRWRNWAKDDCTGNALTADALLDFVNNTLFPTLKKLEVTPETPMRGAIVQATFLDANQYMKDGVLLRQVINIIDQLDLSDYEESHAFGTIYEEILKELQSAGDSGEFYTPRALTDFMAEIIQPQVGERMADLACGTGGFIISWLKALDKKVKTAEDREAFTQSVYGIEKKQFPYMLCITNLLLHDIESPKVYQDNSLTKDVLNYTEDDKFDVFLMNPPYGGKEKNDVKNHFPSDLRSGETADLFMVLIMYRLKENGRAAVILPDGFLFGTDNAKLAIKEKLLREFNVHTIIRLPGSIFSPYTSINTNIIFFNNEKADDAPEGFSTKETWFYRLDMPEGYKHFSKTKPMRVEHCQPICDWWTDRKEMVANDEDGNVVDEKSRCFKVEELMAKACNFDQCKFPKADEEVLPPAELLADYHKRCEALSKSINNTICNIESIITGGTAFHESSNNNCFKELAEITISLPARLRQSILQEAIQGRLVPQDANEGVVRIEKNCVKTPKKLSNFDDYLFDIPETWKWCKLYEIANVIGGYAFQSSDLKSDKGYRVIRISDVTPKGLSSKTIVRCDKKDIPNQYLIKERDILIAMTGGTVGKSLLLESLPEIMYLNQRVAMIRAGENIDCNYLDLLVKSPLIQGIIGDVKNSTNDNISMVDILSFPVPLPPLSEQKRIVAKIEELFGVMK